MWNPNRVVIVGLILVASLVGVDRYVTPHAVQHVPGGPDAIGVGCTDSVGTDTYACTLSPAITAYTTGACYTFKAGTANTGAASINFNALGAKTIVKVAGGVTTALADNDIRSGSVVSLCYDGTNMQMQSLLGNAPAGGGSGSLILLDTCTASASASCAFPTVFSATYNTYKVDVEDLQPATDGTSLKIHVTTNSGSTYETTAYSWYLIANAVAITGTTEIGLSDYIDDVTGSAWEGIVYIKNPLGTTAYKRFLIHGQGQGDIERIYVGGGRWEGTTALTGFRVIAGAGNISGAVRVYGIAK